MTEMELGAPLAMLRRAVDRIERDVEMRRSFLPGAQPIAEENARRIVLDPFADDHLAADVDQVEARR